MSDHFNPAKHSLANRFRPPPQEILLGTPKSRIRPNPSPFSHLKFSTRYRKPPSPQVLTHNCPFAFPSPAKRAIRRGWLSRGASQRGICGHPTRMAILSESAGADEPRGLLSGFSTRRGSVSPSRVQPGPTCSERFASAMVQFLVSLRALGLFTGPPGKDVA